MKKSNHLHKTSKKVLAYVIGMAEILIVTGGITACGMKNNNTTPEQGPAVTNEVSQETAAPDENQPEAESATPDENQQKTDSIAPDENQQKTDSAAQDENLQKAISPETGRTDPVQPDPAQQQRSSADADTAQSGTTQQESVPQNDALQNTKQSGQAGNGQISLEDAKNAALQDAGLSASDVNYTKEKQDYDDGIAVYEIEFWAANVEYEYEIDAATGAVHSKSVENHQSQSGNGANAGNQGTYIDADNAKSIALNHAGFSGADLNQIKAEFDIDDGQAVYEIEFYRDGKEYEYKINATYGTILEYDID